MSKVHIDVRGLEPPEPLVKILHEIETLAPGENLSAWTDRRPLLLIERLVERGYANHCEAQSEGGYVTTITKA